MIVCVSQIHRTTVLDLSGAEDLCSEPAPLEQVKRALARLGPGELLEVRSPIADHAFAVRVWSRKNGVTLVSDERDGATHRLVLATSA
jgi:TusA-related sulfurtransferase